MSSTGPSREVLCGLASNPNTPLSVLLRLATDPEGDWSGPASELLSRGDLPGPVAQALAAHPNTEIRRRLAARPSTPEEVRISLAADPDPLVRAEVAYWPHSWQSWADRLPETMPVLPPEVYRTLSTDPDPKVRAWIGINSYVPLDIRIPLATDPEPEVRRAVAQEHLPHSLVLQLLGDAEPEVRQQALSTATHRARHASIPPELAEGFREGPEPFGEGYHLRMAMANVILDAPLLSRLLTEPELHTALARNPSLPIEQMRAWIAEPSLRAALAQNPGLPEPLLEELVADGDPEVHRVLLERLEIPDHLRRRLIQPEGEHPIVWSLHPDRADLDLRLSYLDHPNAAFRQALAQWSPDLPAEAVLRLTEDPDPVTRQWICINYTDVPPAVLLEATEDAGGWMRQDLLAHPSHSAGTLSHLVTKGGGTPHGDDRPAIAARRDLPPELSRRLLADEDPLVRRTAAGTAHLPVEELWELLADPDPELREGVVSNPGLPVADLERLFTGA